MLKINSRVTREGRDNSGRLFQVILLRGDGGLTNSSGDGMQWLDSSYILKPEPTEFADGSDMGC